MQKISLILGMFFLISGCSVIKKRSVEKNKIEIESRDEYLLESVENQNLTKRSFFIQKAEVEIISGDENQKFLTNIKFVLPDKYLISLRSKTGIEAVRIFLSSDTVLINDRINRKIYFGKPEYLKSKYGISPALLPVLLGDFIYGNEKLNNKVLCDEGKMDFSSVINGMIIRYSIDCNKRKVISARQESSLRNNYAESEYGAFIKEETGFIPSKVELNYNKYRIILKIVRIESKWDGTIDFIPGNNYDLIELL